jgi:hypothetical protein
MFMLIPDTLLPYRYPTGKGKNFYPLRLAGKDTKEIDGYANGRVNALPLPYPAIPSDGGVWSSSCQPDLGPCVASV